MNKKELMAPIGASVSEPQEACSLCEGTGLEPDWVEETCARCEGRGYHHGFGENGVDPDWCMICGGPGHLVRKQIKHEVGG